MKIELIVPSKLNVNREKQYIITDGNFVIDDINYKNFGLALRLTAVDHDINIQEKIYRKGVFAWYRNINGNIGFGLLDESIMIITRDDLTVSLLKKGSSLILFRPPYRIEFEQVYKLSGNKILFIVSGEFPELRSLDPSTKLINPYKGDKNVWQEPFTVCKEVEWSYK